ncbi:MAG: hypothetical protein Q9160_003377 [Pyrenula sp. 1 TL-2023]
MNAAKASGVGEPGSEALAVSLDSPLGAETIEAQVDNSKTECKQLAKWAQIKLSQIEEPLHLDNVRARVGNMSGNIEESVTLLLEAIGISPEWVSNPDFEWWEAADLKIIKELVLGPVLSAAPRTHSGNLRRMVETGSLRLDDLIRQSNETSGTAPSIYKALDLVARQKYLNRNVGPRVGEKAQLYANQIDSEVTILAFAIGKRRALDRQCTGLQDRTPLSYNDNPHTTDWEDQIRTIFTDAFRLRIELEMNSIPADRQYKFRWPVHDDEYDPEWMQQDPQPSPRSARILLPLFPALYVWRGSQEDLVVKALAVPYH